MQVRDLFIEYRGEFHGLFVDVEDEVAGLLEQREPDAPVATPGPDVIQALRTCFAESDYDHGPVRPVSLVRSICRHEAVETLLRETGARSTDLTARLAELEDESGIVFRGWLPQLFRRYWNRGRWTRELAQVLAHASLEGGARHRSFFSCADVLLIASLLVPEIGVALERSSFDRARIRSQLSHGFAEHAPALEADPAGLLNIRVHYDVYSSGALVAQVLEVAFGVADPADSLQRIFDLGSDVFGPFAVPDALARIQMARSMAQGEEAPLRLTTERPG